MVLKRLLSLFVPIYRGDTRSQGSHLPLYGSLSDAELIPFQLYVYIMGHDPSLQYLRLQVADWNSEWGDSFPFPVSTGLPKIKRGIYSRRGGWQCTACIGPTIR